MSRSIVTAMPPLSGLDREAAADQLSIVGACPSCGAPIYGRSVILRDELPQIRHSCLCWRRSGQIENTVETK